MNADAKRQATDVLWTEAMAVALALIIFYASGLSGFAMLAALILAATLSISCVRLLLAANSSAYLRKLSRDEFVGYLYSTLYRKHAGGSYTRAAALAAGEIGYAPLKENMSRKLNRRLLQCDNPDRDGAGVGDRRWAVAEIKRESRRAEAGRSAVEEGAQRYATFNMFISTILPSFMIFAFIGSSVLSKASFSLAIFSSVLLLAVPFFYSFGNLFMWRRLFA